MRVPDDVLRRRQGAPGRVRPAVGRAAAAEHPRRPDHDGYLLQIFTETITDRPTVFFEIIERPAPRASARATSRRCSRRSSATRTVAATLTCVRSPVPWPAEPPSPSCSGPPPRIADPGTSPGRSAEAAMAEHGLDARDQARLQRDPVRPAARRAPTPSGRGAACQPLRRPPGDGAARGAGRPRRVDRRPGGRGLRLGRPAAAAAACRTRAAATRCCTPGRSFIAYPQFTAGRGRRRQVTVPLRRSTIDVDAVLDAVTSARGSCCIANPNNPTWHGAAPRRRCERLVAGATARLPGRHRRGLPRVRHRAPTCPMRSTTVADHPNVVVLRTLSKAYGMAGMRVGFLVADPSIVAAVYATMIPFAVNGPAQAAAMVALQQRDEVERRCALVVAERERVGASAATQRARRPCVGGELLVAPCGRVQRSLAVELERLGVVVRPFPTGIRVDGRQTRRERPVRRRTATRASTSTRRSSNRGVCQPAHSPSRRPSSSTGSTPRSTVSVCTPPPSTPVSTRPVPGETEQWVDRQVWAHMAEFGDYWLTQLHGLLDAGSSSPFPSAAHDTTVSASRPSSAAAARMLPLISRPSSARPIVSPRCSPR